MLPPVPAGVDTRPGVEICTTRAPAGAVDAMLTSAVASVPSAFTETLVTMTVGSAVLFRRNDTAIAPVSPRPTMRSVNGAPPATPLDGVIPRITGSGSTDTEMLAASIALRGASGATLTAAARLRSNSSGGVAPTMLIGRDQTSRPSGGKIVTV